MAEVQTQVNEIVVNRLKLLASENASLRSPRGDPIGRKRKIRLGCAREISNLVLMYSEYQYSLISVRRGIRLLKRYADDGLMIFDSASYDNVVREINALGKP